MGLLGRFDLEHLIERMLAHIDIEEITADVMGQLKIDDLDIFMVLDDQPDSDTPDFVGMAYSERAAREIRDENPTYAPRIMRLSLGKVAAFLDSNGMLEEIQ